MLLLLLLAQPTSDMLLASIHGLLKTAHCISREQQLTCSHCHMLLLLLLLLLLFVLQVTSSLAALRQMGAACCSSATAWSHQQ
jgi:hypothetical protein